MGKLKQEKKKKGLLIHNLVVVFKIISTNGYFGDCLQASETEIVGQIAGKSSKAIAEVQNLVEAKKKKFSGILSGSGAAFMVAKDLGIELGLESVKRVNISQIKEGMQNINLVVKVMQVFSPKEFEKNGKKGKLCSLIVADSTGETRLTVWHDDVRRLSEQGIKRGSVLLLRNCYAKEFNGKPQLSLGFNGSFEANPKNEMFADLPEVKMNLVKVSGLAEGLNDVSLIARLLRKFPATEFEKGERKGKVMNFLVGDKTGTVRVTAWNELVAEAQKFGENDVVEIEGGYTKPGLKGIELHLGWQSRLGKGKDSGEIPGAGQMLKEKAERKKILELKQGDVNVLVEGKIVLVNQGMLYYNICPGCGGKLQRLEEGILCDKCGEVKEPGIRPVVSVRIDDGSGQIDVTAFGKEAEKIIGVDKDKLKKLVAENGREKLLEELQGLSGKQITVVGKVRDNSFSGQTELTASLVELK